jgi:predicted kinase
MAPETISGGPAGAPAVALVVGGTGAGKTTFAARFAGDVGGLLVSIDDWVDTLYASDKPPEPGFDWYMERIGRIETQIRAVAGRLVALAVPVLLDLGFTARAHRAAWIAWARELGAEPWIYYVDVPADQRWRRVEQRNRDRGSTYRLDVNRGMFDFMEARFEPPTADEAPLARVTS